MLEGHECSCSRFAKDRKAWLKAEALFGNKDSIDMAYRSMCKILSEHLEIRTVWICHPYLCVRACLFNR